MRNRPLALTFRPLVVVSLLAGGDYLLWSWSSEGGHDLLALVSGLTMTPLAIALIWLLVLNSVRLAAQFARSRRAQRPGEQHLQHGPRRHGAQQQQQQQQQQRQHEGGEQTSSSSKLAA